MMEDTKFITGSPMENIDKQSQRDVSDEDLLMAQVICDDAELFYLDVFLAEILSKEA